jgi:hypothetical protein
LERQVMQQNQRHGTQPEIVQNIRGILVPQLPGKKFQAGWNFCRVSFLPDERCHQPKQKRPGKPGRSLIAEAVRGFRNPSD